MLPGVLSQLLGGDLMSGTGEAGASVYLIFFAIILLENGFPPMIWLPGDSLLFLSGMIAATGTLDISWLLFVYLLAAFCGYELSYLLGLHLGLPLISRHFSWIVTDTHLKKSGEFYCRWGSAAITIARFVPVIRTLTPFLAGISRMRMNQFTAYNILGAMIWPPVVCGFGYLCGVLPWLASYRDTIFMVVSVIFVMSILFSVSLIVISWARSRIC